MNTLTRPELALTTPRSPHNLTLDLGVMWEEMLKNAGFNVALLLHPFEDIESLNESEEILQQADGLVIASSRTRHIPFDGDNLTHIQFAKRLKVPVFVEVPIEETAMPEKSSLGSPASLILDGAEVIHIGSDFGIIRKRLNAGIGVA